MKTKFNYKSITVGILFAMVFIAAFSINMAPKLPVFAAFDGNTGIPDTAWYDTDQSETEFTISTADELAGLQQIVARAGHNFDRKTIILANDIDLSSYGKGAAFNDGKGWIPIGTSLNNFAGTFDGNNRIITGLYLNDSSRAAVGLFGMVYGLVKNLHLIDVDITAPYNVSNNGSAGGIAARLVGSGYYELSGTIENCSVTGIINGTPNIGGIVGSVSISPSSGPATIRNCWTDVAINTDESISNISNTWREVGGIAGSNNGGDISNCYALGTVSGYQSVGGIAGFSSAGSIMNCVAFNDSVKGTYYSGRVVGNKYDVGGTYETLTANNYALSSMEDTNNSYPGWNDKTLNGKDGKDVTMADAKTSGFWKDELNWETAAWDDSVWIMENGFLPALYRTNISLATVEFTEGASELKYNGTLQAIPDFTVKFTNRILNSGYDYTFKIISTSSAVDSTSDGINAGEVTIEITGIGLFNGTVTKTYTINKADPTINPRAELSQHGIYNISTLPVLVPSVGDMPGKLEWVVANKTFFHNDGFGNPQYYYDYRFIPDDNINYNEITAPFTALITEYTSEAVLTSISYDYNASKVCRRKYVDGETFDVSGHNIMIYGTINGVAITGNAAGLLNWDYLNGNSYQIIYQNGDALKRGDTSVIIKYTSGGVTVETQIYGLTVDRSTNNDDNGGNDNGNNNGDFPWVITGGVACGIILLGGTIIFIRKKTAKSKH